MIERLIRRLNAEARRTVEGIRAQNEGREHPRVRVNARGVSHTTPADILASAAGQRQIRRTTAADLTRRSRPHA
jgi:hypothetical protein